MIICCGLLVACVVVVCLFPPAPVFVFVVSLFVCIVSLFVAPSLALVRFSALPWVLL